MAKSKTGKKHGGVRGTMEAKKALESLAIEPLKDMHEMAIDDGVSEAIRAKLLMELAQYVYPKIKAVGPDTADGEDGDDAADEEEKTSYEERLERTLDGK
jgi:hypothetical protein